MWRLILILFCLVMPAMATDTYLTNRTATPDFQTPNNWNPNSIPVITDNAFFTNNLGQAITLSGNATNANVYIRPANGTLTFTQNLSTFSWLVTNSVNIADTANATSVVTHTAGTLLVTNRGFGTYSIGNVSKGTLNLNGGSIVADQFYSSNQVVGLGGTNSFFSFNSGNLTTLSNFYIKTLASSFIVGNTAGKSATWNAQGGTNVIDIPGGFNWQLGAASGSTGIVNVIGSGTFLTNGNAILVNSANAGSVGFLTVSNGATLINAGTFSVGGVSGSNVVFVSDLGSSLKSVGNATLGSGASGGGNNMMTISNGASFTENGTTVIGSTAQSQNNLAILWGSGSAWTNTGNLTVGNNGSNNTMIVNAGSLVCAANLTIGSSGTNNLLVVTNGGSVQVAGTGTLSSSSGTNNMLFVSDTGSIFTNSGILSVGSVGQGLITVTNGGVMSAAGIRLGVTNVFQSTIYANGADSLLHSQNSVGIFVGTNAVTRGKGNILLENNATLQANTLVAGLNGSGNITNNMGVYQFSVATPAFTNCTGGAMSLVNGDIAFTTINGFNVSNNWIGTLTNVFFSGTNGLMLKQSTTNSVMTDYTFAGNLGPTNYWRLTMAEPNCRWLSGVMTIGANGGMLLVSNSPSATVSTLLTNNGTIVIRRFSTATFESNVVNNSTWNTMIGTNIFLTNVVTSASGYMLHSTNGLWRFDRNWTQASTNNVLNDMTNVLTAVLFTNGGGSYTHILNLAGSSAIDRGATVTNLAGVMTNLAIGNLKMAPGDLLMITGGSANALYVGKIDVGSQSLANINNLITGCNVYYDTNFTENNYLLGATYNLGAKQLIPMGRASSNTGRSGDFFHVFY